MKFGLTAPQFQYITNTVIIPFKNIGLQIYCFGSRARGNNHPFSDLDLMIEGPITDDAQKLKHSIAEKLSNENFPFKVDLVFFDEYSDAYKASYIEDKVSWE